MVWHEEEDDQSIFYTYPGTIEKDKLIDENIHVRKNYTERWSNFIKLLKPHVKKNIADLSIMGSCFSGAVQLKKRQSNDCIITKELHFAVSLLGPYYTIYGLDQATILLEPDPPKMLYENMLYDRDERGTKHTRKYHRTASHAVTVSPLLEYEQDFLFVQQKITEWFTGYKFIPYSIYSMRLKGLDANPGSVNGKDSDCIYHALFNHELDMSIDVRGDKYYGYKEWLKDEGPLAKEAQLLLEKKVAESILSAKNHRKDVSLHRVWKYKSYTRLPISFKGMMSNSLTGFLPPKEGDI